MLDSGTGGNMNDHVVDVQIQINLKCTYRMTPFNVQFINYVQYQSFVTFNSGLLLCFSSNAFQRNQNPVLIQSSTIPSHSLLASFIKDSLYGH